MDNIGGADDSKDSVNTENAEVKALKSHSEKLLAEKKKLAKDHDDLKQKLATMEQQSLEAQGKYKEMYEQAKKTAEDKEVQVKNLVKEFGSKTLKSSFTQEAQKAGCIDAEALYRLVDLGTVEIGDNFSFNQDQLKTVLVEAQKSRSYLFNKEASAPKDATPNNKQQNGTLDLSKLTFEEKVKLLALKQG